MEKWIIASNPEKKVGYTLEEVLSVLGGVVFVIMILVWYKNHAGFWQIAPVILIGGVMVMIVIFFSYKSPLDSGRKVITVDPELRKIIIEDTYQSNRTTQTIHFDNIRKVYVDDGISLYEKIMYETPGFLDVVNYDIVLKLDNSSKFYLFGKYYFEGRTNESTMEERKKKLQTMLRNTPITQ